MAQLIDMGRAKIDTALKNNDKQTALVTAQRLFPRMDTMLESAMIRGDEDAFRQLCGIQEPCEWVDGEFLPGTLTQHNGVVIPAPQPGYQFDLPAAMESVKPLAFGGLFIGGLCIAAAFVFAVCQGILTGVSAAFVVIGEYIGYIAFVAIAFLMLRVIFASGSKVETETTQSGGGIYVTNNFNINGNSGTNSIQ